MVHIKSRVQTETESTEYSAEYSAEHSAELLFGFLKYSAEYQYCKNALFGQKLDKNYNFKGYSKDIQCNFDFTIK